MAVSSNRTNIPIPGAWDPNENCEKIELLLKLIHRAYDKIETALGSAIKTIFPNATWNLFWKLILSDHPVIFRSTINQIFAIQEDLPSQLQSSQLDSFASYFEGVKYNGLKTSSPCESINSDIRHLKNEPPIVIFHFLEVLGFSGCLDLLDNTCSIKIMIVNYCK